MSMPVQSQPSPTAQFIDERLLTARLEAVEARTETKFAQLLGEMRLIGQRVSDLSTTVTAEIKDVKRATATVKWNILATGIALGALILGLFAYGQQMMQIAAALVGLKR
jgi:hypothetical protein